jgi:predicted N-acetyltransferase YhbS
METVEFGALPPEVRSELHGDEVDPFDAGRVPPIEWRQKDRNIALRDPDGTHVASAGILIAEVEIAGERIPVVGLGGVMVRAADRGRGRARQVVTAALAGARSDGPAFALLFCHADRCGLYAKLGFVVIAEPVTVEQPDGPLAMPMVGMWRALRDGASWPPGPVTVLGLPF